MSDSSFNPLEKLKKLAEEYQKSAEQEGRIQSIKDLLIVHYNSWLTILNSLPSAKSLNTKLPSLKIGTIQQLHNKFLTAQKEYNVIKNKISELPFLHVDDKTIVAQMKQEHIDKINTTYREFFYPAFLAVENRLKELESPKVSKKPAASVPPPITATPVESPSVAGNSLSASTDSLLGEETIVKEKQPVGPELPPQIFPKTTSLNEKFTQLDREWDSNITLFRNLDVNTLNDLDDVNQKIETLQQYQAHLAEAVSNINHQPIEPDEYHEFHQVKKANLLIRLNDYLNNIVTLKLDELETYKPTLEAKLAEAQRQQQIEAERREAERLEAERQEEIRRREEAERREKAETERKEEEARRAQEEEQRRAQEKAEEDRRLAEEKIREEARRKEEEARLKAEEAQRDPVKMTERLNDMKDIIENYARVDVNILFDPREINLHIMLLKRNLARVMLEEETLTRALKDNTLLSAFRTSPLKRIRFDSFKNTWKMITEEEIFNQSDENRAYQTDLVLEKIEEYKNFLINKQIELEKRIILENWKKAELTAGDHQPQVESNIPLGPQVENSVSPGLQAESVPLPPEIIVELPPEAEEIITSLQLPKSLQAKVKKPVLVEKMLPASTTFFTLPLGGLVDFRSSEEKITAAIFDQWVLYFEDLRQVDLDKFKQLPASKALAYYTEFTEKEKVLEKTLEYFGSHIGESQPIDGMFKKLNQYYAGIVISRLEGVKEKAEMFKELTELGRQFTPEQLKRINTPFTLADYEENKKHLFRSIFNDVENANKELAQFEAKHESFKENPAELGFSLEGEELQTAIIKQRFDKYIELRDKIAASPNLQTDKEILAYEEKLRQVFNAFEKRIYEIKLNKWDVQTNSPNGIGKTVKKEIARLKPLVTSMNTNYLECVRLSGEAQTKFETRPRIIDHSEPQNDGNPDTQGKFLEDHIDFIDARIEEEAAYFAQLMLIAEDIQSSNAKADSFLELTDYVSNPELDPKLLDPKLDYIDKILLSDDFDINNIEFGNEEVEFDEKLYEALQKIEVEPSSHTQTRQNKIAPESTETTIEREIKEAGHQVLDPQKEHLDAIRNRNNRLSENLQTEMRLTQKKLYELSKQKKKDMKSLRAYEQNYFIGDKYHLVNSDIFNAIKKFVLTNDNLNALLRHGQKRKQAQISLYFELIKGAKNLDELLTAIKSDPRINEYFSYSMRDRTGFGRFFGNPQKSTSNNLANILETEVNQFINGLKNDLTINVLERQAIEEFEIQAKEAKARSKFTKS